MVTETDEKPTVTTSEPAEPAVTTEPSASVAADSQTTQSAAGSSEPSAGGDEQAPSFESDLAEVRGKATAPPAANTLPGKTLDQLWEEETQGKAGQWAQLMQLAESGAMSDNVLDQLGLDRQTGNAYWQKMRPYVLAARDLAEGHNLSLTDALIKSVLTDAERKDYESRNYIAKNEQGQVLPASSRKNGLEAALKIREQSRDKDWQAKIDRGDYLSKSDAEKIVELRLARQLKSLEDAGRLIGGSSGQKLSGGGASSSNPEQVLNSSTSTLEQKKAAFKQLHGFEMPL